MGGDIGDLLIADAGTSLLRVRPAAATVFCGLAAREDSTERCVLELARLIAGGEPSPDTLVFSLCTGDLVLDGVGGVG